MRAAACGRVRVCGRVRACFCVRAGMRTCVRACGRLRACFCVRACGRAYVRAWCLRAAVCVKPHANTREIAVSDHGGPPLAASMRPRASHAILQVRQIWILIVLSSLPVRSHFNPSCEINRVRSDAQNQLARLIAFRSVLADTCRKWSDRVSVETLRGVVK